MLKDVDINSIERDETVDEDRFPLTGPPHTTNSLSHVGFINVLRVDEQRREENHVIGISQVAMDVSKGKQVVRVAEATHIPAAEALEPLSIMTVLRSSLSSVLKSSMTFSFDGWPGFTFSFTVVCLILHVVKASETWSICDS